MKQYFFLRLISPRPTFNQDMTAEERSTMQRHVAYWTDLLAKGYVPAFGPVMDPAGVYGISVIGVANQAELDSLIAGDPAQGLHMRYESFPMRAVVPEGFR